LIFPPLTATLVPFPPPAPTLFTADSIPLVTQLSTHLSTVFVPTVCAASLPPRTVISPTRIINFPLASPPTSPNASFETFVPDLLPSLSQFLSFLAVLFFFFAPPTPSCTPPPLSLRHFVDLQYPLALTPQVAVLFQGSF